jgi:hypothetical protein
MMVMMVMMVMLVVLYNVSLDYEASFHTTVYDHVLMAYVFQHLLLMVVVAYNIYMMCVRRIVRRGSRGNDVDEEIYHNIVQDDP